MPPHNNMEPIFDQTAAACPAPFSVGSFFYPYEQLPLIAHHQPRGGAGVIFLRSIHVAPGGISRNTSANALDVCDESSPFLVQSIPTSISDSSRALPLRVFATSSSVDSYGLKFYLLASTSSARLLGRRKVLLFLTKKYYIAVCVPRSQNTGFASPRAHLRCF